MSHEFYLPAIQMHDVHPEQRAATRELIDIASKITREAPVAPSNAENGITWRYGGESLTYAEDANAPGVVRHIAPAEEPGQFVVIDDADNETPVEMTRRNHMMYGKEILDFRRMRAALRMGNAIGSYEIFAEKSLVTGSNTDGDALLQVAVTRISVGDGLPAVPIVDLRLLRTNPPVNRSEGDITVIQSHRLEHADGTIALRVGDSIAVENYIPPIPSDPNSKGTTIYDENPDYTSARFQRMYRPQLPLDAWLSGPTWQQLIQQPLPLDYLMRAK